MSRWILLVLILGISGCHAGWQSAVPAPGSVMDPNQQVQVWRKNKALRWHGVVISTDSVSGLHFLAPLDCDSCRVTYPVSEIDSIRIGNPPAGFMKSVGLFLGVWLIVSCMAFCGAGFD